MDKKTRCNMYLDDDNVKTVKTFLKGTGLTFSSYINLFLEKAAKEIDFYDSLAGDEIPDNYLFEEENGKRYFNIADAHRILGLSTSDGGYVMSQDQRKKIESGKWKFEVTETNKLVLCIGKAKNKK